MAYTAADIAQVLEIPGCKLLCKLEGADDYRLTYRLPDGTKFTVTIKTEREVE